MPPTDSRAAPCVTQAVQAKAQLLGTAAQAPFYLALEWPHPWKRKAVRDADLPAPLREAVAAWTEAVPGLRVQLVRREAKRFDAEGVTAAYLCRTSLHAPALWRARVADPEALAGADVPALLLGDASATDASGVFARTGERLVLTCTHGKRDACCALHGRRLHAAFAEQAGAAAWQTSHVKGHRFAPTCVLLPHGVHYGWLPPHEAEATWAAYADGRLHRLDRYRGHTGFAYPVQAAAAFARRLTDAHDLDAVRLLSVDERPLDGGGEEAWRVRLAVRESTGAEVPYALGVRRVPDATVATSCDGAPKPTARFLLDALQRDV